LQKTCADRHARDAPIRAQPAATKTLHSRI
jgi:hypothetical protein